MSKEILREKLHFGYCLASVFKTAINKQHSQNMDGLVPERLRNKRNILHFQDIFDIRLHQKGVILTYKVSHLQNVLKVLRIVVLKVLLYYSQQFL
jgi:hypothetical protein